MKLPLVAAAICGTAAASADVVVGPQHQALRGRGALGLPPSNLVELALSDAEDDAAKLESLLQWKSEHKHHKHREASSSHKSQKSHTVSLDVWPQPAKWSGGASTLRVQPGASFFSAPKATKRLEKAFARYAAIAFPHSVADDDATAAPPANASAAGGGASAAPAALRGLEVHVEELVDRLPTLGEDESYTLTVDDKKPVAVLSSKTVVGALRGLETFSQLVTFDFDAGAYRLKGAPLNIEDKPRFPHRGLMVDTSRHFEPLAAIKGIVDSLPYAKLNVLHWHVTDQQSFPLEVKSFPKLWQGSYSGSERYTQQDVRDVVSYAADRGIRVVPEFDMPGHAASWCAGYPEICPSHYCKMPLNVASNATWNVLEGLLHEVSGGRPSTPDSPAGLFPDEFLHLGGDEVDTACWDQSPEISAWLQGRNMTSKQGYAYFAKRAAEIAVKNGRRPVQWAEVFDAFGSELDTKTIIHVWKRETDVAKVVSLGYDVIRNVGYTKNSWYLDNLDVRWDAVYQAEPCEGISSDELCSKILGGHGEMWGETVDASDLQQTVWPRLAAIGEKLWSPRERTQEAFLVRDRLKNFRCVLLERGVAAAPIDMDGRGNPMAPGACGYRSDA